MPRLAPLLLALLLAGCARGPDAPAERAECALPQPLLSGGPQALEVYVRNEADLEDRICYVVQEPTGVVAYGAIDLERRGSTPNLAGQRTAGIDGDAFVARVWLASQPPIHAELTFARGDEHHLVVTLSRGPALSLERQASEPAFV